MAYGKVYSAVFSNLYLLVWCTYLVYIFFILSSNEEIEMDEINIAIKLLNLKFELKPFQIETLLITC